MIGFGLGFGIASLASPALLADRYGTVAYGAIAGTLATPVTLAKAAAPLGAAALLTATGSYTPVLAAITTTCLIAAVAILARATAPAPTPPHNDQLLRSTVPPAATSATKELTPAAHLQPERRSDLRLAPPTRRPWRSQRVPGDCKTNGSGAKTVVGSVHNGRSR